MEKKNSGGIVKKALIISIGALFLDYMYHLVSEVSIKGLPMASNEYFATKFIVGLVLAYIVLNYFKKEKSVLKKSVVYGILSGVAFYVVLILQTQSCPAGSYCTLYGTYDNAMHVFHGIAYGLGAYLVLSGRVYFNFKVKKGRK